MRKDAVFPSNAVLKTQSIDRKVTAAKTNNPIVSPGVAARNDAALQSGVCTGAQPSRATINRILHCHPQSGVRCAYLATVHSSLVVSLQTRF